jgi:hypothetical protein
MNFTVFIYVHVWFDGEFDIINTACDCSFGKKYTIKLQQNHIIITLISLNESIHSTKSIFIYVCIKCHCYVPYKIRQIII